MRRADEDGTAPVHMAAARGNLEVLKLLHEHGVDMEASGAIYLSVEGSAQLRTGVTPIMLAHRNLASADQDDASAENDRAQLIVQFLESVRPPTHIAKRERSAVSIQERAALVGVTNRLNPIPVSLYTRIESGSDTERAAAKKELHKLQKANQQIVSRAEQSRLTNKRSWCETM
jgi:ankyrin repeat protein